MRLDEGEFGMPYCGNCGIEVTGNFCSNCGQKVILPPQSLQESTPESTTKPAPESITESTTEPMPESPTESKQEPSPESTASEAPPPSSVIPQYSYPTPTIQGPPPTAKPRHFISNPVVFIGIIFMLIGCLGLMAGPVDDYIHIETRYYNPITEESEYNDYGWTISESPRFRYGRLLDIFGPVLLLLCLMVVGSTAFRKKTYARLLWIIPIFALLFSIILLIHMLSAHEVFIESPYIVEDYYADIGFFLTSFGSIFAIIGGFLISRQVSRLAPKPTGPPTPMGARDGQPPAQFPPQQQYQQPQQPSQQKDITQQQTYPCPKCGQPLRFMNENKYWYCYNCGKSL